MKKLLIWLVLSSSLLGLFIGVIVTGTADISLTDIYTWLTDPDKLKPGLEMILVDFRLSKAITALVAGAALGVSGLLMQTIFRNPLAGPYVLGISSGAGLGVAITVVGSAFLGFNFSGALPVFISASIGSGLFLLIIFILSVRVRDTLSVLVLGFFLGAIASALITIIQYFGEAAELKKFVLWSMGSLGNTTWDQITIMIIIVTAGIGASFLIARALNAFLIGENIAFTGGVNTRLMRILGLIYAGLLAATVTAFCGPVGFVGIAVPHIARAIFSSSNHFIIIPASVIIGASVLLLSDMVSQIPGNGVILPVNAITALIGIPVIIWFVLNKRRMHL